MRPARRAGAERLRRALMLGFANRLARRMPQHNGYRTLGAGATLAQLHPATARIAADEAGLLPEWLIYHELVATARTFLSKARQPDGGSAGRLAWLLPCVCPRVGSYACQADVFFEAYVCTSRTACARSGSGLEGRSERARADPASQGGSPRAGVPGGGGVGGGGAAQAAQRGRGAAQRRRDRGAGGRARCVAGRAGGVAAARGAGGRAEEQRRGGGRRARPLPGAPGCQGAVTRRHGPLCACCLIAERLVSTR